MEEEQNGGDLFEMLPDYVVIHVMSFLVFGGGKLFEFEDDLRRFCPSYSGPGMVGVPLSDTDLDGMRCLVHCGEVFTRMCSVKGPTDLEDDQCGSPVRGMWRVGCWGGLRCWATVSEELRDTGTRTDGARTSPCGPGTSVPQLEGSERVPQLLF